MTVEVGEVSSSRVLKALGVGDELAGVVYFAVGLRDGGFVASRPAAGELFVEGDLAAGELLFGVVSGCGVGAQGGASARSVIAEILRERGFDGGELVGEVPAADAQGFDAVGEGLVGADAGEGDAGPVLVELFPGVVDRVAPPTVLFLVSVVGGLFSGEPGDLGLGGGDGSGGIDRCAVSARQMVVELASLSAAVSGEGGEHADSVERVLDVVDGALGGDERGSGGGKLADGVVKLALAVGGLVVEDVLVGRDQLA